jgi:LPS-assembly protein
MTSRIPPGVYGLIHEGQARLLAGTTAQEINLGYIARDAIYDPSHIVDGTSAALAPVPERQNRWFLNLRHNGGWESRIKTAATYSAVSDRDYPGDIGGDIGSSSYDQAISPVESSLSDPRSAMLQRRAEVQYRGDVWNTAVTVQEFQNLHPDADEEYATLPRLSADRRGTLGPASLDVSLEYASFDRENDGLTGTDRIVGDRSVADVALSWRRSAAWGFFQPGLGVVYRQYGLRDTVVGSQTNPAETTSRLSLDTGLYFDRYFQTGAHLLHQTLEPRLFYLHVEADDQQDLPLFDSGVLTPGFRRLFRHNRFNGNDRIGDANQVSLGITTRYLDSTNGAQLLEASVGQTYYFADRTVIFPGSTGEDATARESPLFAELRLRLASGLSLASTIEWNAAAGNTNRSTLSLKYNAGYRKLLNLNYLYATASGGSTMASVSESDINFIWPIRGNWSATGQWNFSWDRDQTVQSLYGVEYNDCCWKARVILRRFLKEPRETTYLTDDLSSQTGYTAMTGIVTPAETGIFVELQLKGLAMLGRRVDVLLERVIPGYREREDKVGR